MSFVRSLDRTITSTRSVIRVALARGRFILDLQMGETYPGEWGRSDRQRCPASGDTSTPDFVVGVSALNPARARLAVGTRAPTI